MKRYIVLFVAMVCALPAFAQNQLTIKLKDAKSADPLIGATVFITGFQ